MGYSLGVDLGTTYSAAAVARDGNVEVATLDTDAPQIPSVVVLREDGEILTGAAAERRSSTEPTRTAREFKRRLGDPVPLIIGGTPYGAEALMAHLLKAIVAQVAEREGAAPDTVVLTHPANYTDYKRGLLEEAARLADLDLSTVQFLTEPEAAAITYARQQGIEAGQVVAVYDFGGGTFDAAVVRRTATGFEVLGTPEGMERLGGVDFDQAVLAYVDAALDGMVSGADPDDPNVRAGQSRLRDQCRQAKEALSVDTDTSVPVSLPGLQTDVRLTRDELEAMVRPRIGETVAALDRAVTSAGLTMDDISRVLLVGGTSRMPVVAQEVRNATGRPVALDAHPKFAIATGAALAGAARRAEDAVDTAGPAAVVPTNEGVGAGTAVAAAGQARTPAAKARTATARPRFGLIAGVILGSAAIAGGAVVVMSGDGDDPPANADAVNTTTTVAASPTGARGVEGVVSLVAGNGQSAAGAEAGPAESVSIGDPPVMAVTSDGVVYLGGTGRLARVEDGEVTVVEELPAGDLLVGGVDVAPDGSVWFTTAAGLRHLPAGGVASELAAAAGDGNVNSTPGPVTVDGSGNAYFFDVGSRRVLRFGAGGGLSVVAGSGTEASVDGAVAEGEAATAQALGDVTAMVVSPDGNLLIVDATLRRVLTVDGSGAVTTLAGGGATPVQPDVQQFADDGTTATDLELLAPSGIEVDGDGRAYVADELAHLIFRIDDGRMTLVAGDQRDTTEAFGQPANATRFTSADQLAFDGTGDLYVLGGNMVRRIADVASS